MKKSNKDFTSALILSTGRTGTMFFAQTLSDLVPQAAVYHEAGESSRLINIFTNAHLSNVLPENFAIWAWRIFMAEKINSAVKHKSFYIDANNHLYAFVNLQPHLFPGLKIIHIVRDPRSYVRSHLNWARHRLKSFIANHLIPFWQPNPFLLREMTFFQWGKISQLERFAWIWDYKNGLIETITQSQIPYLRIRFEDIFHSSTPEVHFNKLLELLELPLVEDLSEYLHQSVNPNKGDSFPAWPEWSTEQARRLESLCGETMKKYGYGDEPAWMDKINTNLEN